LYTNFFEKCLRNYFLSSHEIDDEATNNVN
jgi:hypothetical protein